MALSGTLKDFGIADIFQLIGNQQKTGSLVLKNDSDDLVEIGFYDGNVVSATERHRKSTRYLGAMLVRAELVTASQLEEALVQQKRSLKRLGDILVEIGAIPETQLAQMARLQTTETVYRLFEWKSGTYEFNQKDIDAGKHAFEPIRAETILLEGFRRTDEWPAVQKALPQLDATVRRVKPIAAPGEMVEIAPAAHLSSRPGARHDAIYHLASNPEHTLQKLADLSRLGDFEALKVVQELVASGNFELVPPPRGGRAAIKELAAGGRLLASSGWLMRIIVGGACFALTLLFARQWQESPDGSVAQREVRRGAGAHLIARAQLLRLEGALEVYKLEHGDYPVALRMLVESQLVLEKDLSYPFDKPYTYRRSPPGFVLLPPLD